jgi:hypothetical protein
MCGPLYRCKYFFCVVCLPTYTNERLSAVITSFFLFLNKNYYVVLGGWKCEAAASFVRGTERTKLILRLCFQLEFNFLITTKTLCQATIKSNHAPNDHQQKSLSVKLKKIRILANLVTQISRNIIASINTKLLIICVIASSWRFIFSKLWWWYFKTTKIGDKRENSTLINIFFGALTHSLVYLRESESGHLRRVKQRRKNKCRISDNCETRVDMAKAKAT